MPSNDLVDLVCPRRLEYVPALRFIDSLPEYLTTPRVQLDFSRLTFARPHATLLVADALKSFIEDRHDLGMQTFVDEETFSWVNTSQAVSYLGHVGFFEYVGVEYGNAPGVASGSRTYVPLTVITRTELANESRNKVVQTAVLARCRHIASLVFNNESKQDMLMYCLREIIRNVFEHAATDSCTVMAQKWTEDEVQIAISDRGVGVYLSLREAYAVSSAEDAVRLALQPGISRITGHQLQGEWDNTGFGLYILSRLGQRFGSFTLTTSGVSLTRTAHAERVRATGFPGTAVGLTVRTTEAEYFPNIHNQIVVEGEQLAAAAGTKRAGASKQPRLW